MKTDKGKNPGPKIGGKNRKGWGNVKSEDNSKKLEKGGADQCRDVTGGA